MKKGILFTTGLALLATAVLALAITSTYQLEKIQDLVFDKTAYSRAYNEYNTIAKDVKDIVLNTSGLKIEVLENTVTFNEFIQNPSAATYQSTIDTYRSFALNQTDNTQLQLTTLRNNLLLEIQPHSINYTHSTVGGTDILVQTPNVNMTNYSVTVVCSENVSSCAWNIPDGDKGTRLEVNVIGDPGSCSGTYLVDPSQTSRLNVNSGGLTVEVKPGGWLTVENNFVTAVNVSTTLYLTAVTDNIIAVYIPDGAVITAYEDYEIVKSGGIKIADGQ